MTFFTELGTVQTLQLPILTLWFPNVDSNGTLSVLQDSDSNCILHSPVHSGPFFLLLPVILSR